MRSLTDSEVTSGVALVEPDHNELDSLLEGARHSTLDETEILVSLDLQPGDDADSIASSWAKVWAKTYAGSTPML